MIIAFDIDDTITKKPAFFALLSKTVIREGGRVVIISLRSNVPKTVNFTKEQLKSYGVQYNRLALIDSLDIAKQKCPHKGLDWWEKYIWQKVDICQKEEVKIVFEDDEKVIALFRRFAPEIQVYKAMK